jgi:hypothetical protein
MEKLPCSEAKQIDLVNYPASLEHLLQNKKSSKRAPHRGAFNLLPTYLPQLYNADLPSS